jgi:hypothetical protein
LGQIPLLSVVEGHMLPFEESQGLQVILLFFTATPSFCFLSSKNISERVILFGPMTSLAGALVSSSNILPYL